MRALALSSAVATAAAGSGAYVTLNATKITHQSWVRATFSVGSYKPATDGFLAVQCPANASTATIPAQAYPASAPWIESFPAKWALLTQAHFTSAQEGYYDFNLWNPFESCAINLYGGSIDKPVFLAGANVTFTDDATPLRGHIARIPESPTDMLVTWHSKYGDGAPVVQWGTTPGGPYPNSAPATAASYDKSDLCGLPATGPGWFPSHFWLSARISGLELGSGQRIYYTYGSAHGMSAEASFVTPPAPGAKQSIAMGLLADCGVTEIDGAVDHWDEPDATTTYHHILDRVVAEGNYSLVLHPGDISYATGTLLKWEAHMSILQPLAEKVPYMVGHGNHERDWPGTGTYYNDSTDSGGECGVATNTRFPGSIDAYSFQHGPVNVLMLNSEMAVSPGSPQYAFAQQALSSVDRSVTPWSIVAFHRPMYAVSDVANGGYIDTNFQQLEPLFVSSQVDMVFVGHVHNSYVSCPVVNGTCVTPSEPGAYAAPVHVCIGNAGQGITPINPTHPPSWARFQQAEWGYSTMHVDFDAATSTSTMRVDLYDDATNTLQYSVSLQRAVA